jgi:hypothetical protein
MVVIGSGESIISVTVFDMDIIGVQEHEKPEIS